MSSSQIHLLPLSSPLIILQSYGSPFPSLTMQAFPAPVPLHMQFLLPKVPLPLCLAQRTHCKTSPALREAYPHHTISVGIAHRHANLSLSTLCVSFTILVKISNYFISCLNIMDNSDVAFMVIIVGLVLFFSTPAMVSWAPHRTSFSRGHSPPH